MACRVCLDFKHTMSTQIFRNQKFFSPWHYGVKGSLFVPISEDCGCSVRLGGWEQEIRVKAVSLEEKVAPFKYSSSSAFFQPLGGGHGTPHLVPASLWSSRPCEFACRLYPLEKLASRLAS